MLMFQLGKYMHISGLGPYRVLATALFTGKPPVKAVVFRAEYESSTVPFGSIWIAPADYFTESIHHKGRKGPRYQYIGDECEDPLPKNTW